VEKETGSMMKTTSFLSALVVVLGFCGEAGAKIIMDTNHDYTLKLGGYKFGFADGMISGSEVPTHSWSAFCLGPLGGFDVPFTATQGLVGFCCILATLIILPVVLTVRWKKKRVN
jgi:hypothetical protein